MFKNFLRLFIAVAITLSAAHGNVTLPPLISDNMLLQSSQAAVWGKADPGEAVTVTLGHAVATATADQDRNWRVKLVGLTPGVAGAMSVAGKNKLTISNVSVGDVWVCSGQSNMDMTLAKTNWHNGVLHADEEIAAAKFPEIRMFIVSKDVSATPLEKVGGKWQVCSPETVPHWSATAYFFGRQLHRDLDVPIGLILAAWGGIPAQNWTPTEVLQGDPDFKTTYYDKWQQQLKEYPQRKAKYDQEILPAWQAAADAAQKAGQPAPKKPRPPIGAPTGPGAEWAASGLYNAMIAGATRYSIKGAIWYQGEANAWDAARYRRLLPAMIASWRKAWDQESFPFYIAQLPNYGPIRPEPADSLWAELREAQRAISLDCPHCGLAVAIDLGEENNIHPPNKQEVGRRIALVAEAKTYGKDVVFSGPCFDAAKFDASSVTLTFQHGTALGLATKDGGPLKGFAIAGEDKKFVWADARIVPLQKAAQAGTAATQEAGIVLTSPEVPKPVAVRYAWANSPVVNLVNQAGLPAGPFRTDAWPQHESPAAATTPTNKTNR